MVMKLFYLKTDEAGMDCFLRENYISLDLDGILIDFESMGKEQALTIAGSINIDNGHLKARVEQFVYAMQDGDYIIASDGMRGWLGDVGDYFFVADQSEQAEENPHRHRRGVTWLKRVELAHASELWKIIMRNTETFTILSESLSLEEIDRQFAMDAEVDHETVQKALQVLREALESDDMDRRERAAAAILLYAKK